MNRNINNIFNKREVENKLKDFKKGKDYSISPTDEPNIKTYNFYNDRLRSMFRDDRIPVRIVREAYDGKDYTYRGHFEEGKDYGYSYQSWDYSKGKSDYREMRGYPRPVEVWVENELKRADVEKRSVSIYVEGGKIGENGLEKHWESKENYENIKNTIKEYESKIQEEKDWLDKNGKQVEKEQSNNHSDLKKENQELRQQLSEVQKQLTEVLEELKKLKSNINGKGGEKLEQQIVQNERLIKDSENVSVAEVKEQVQKSQALMNELNTSASTNQDNKGNGSLPYVIGGSVILAVAGIVGYLVVRKSKRK